MKSWKERKAQKIEELARHMADIIVGKAGQYITYEEALERTRRFVVRREAETRFHPFYDFFTDTGYNMAASTIAIDILLQAEERELNGTQND